MAIQIRKALVLIALCAAWQISAGQTTDVDDTVIIEDVAPQNPLSLSRQQGDKRPEGQFQTRLFGRSLTIGGEVELRPELRDNLDLDPDADDEFTRVGQKIELEAFYEINSRLYAFGEAKFRSQQDRFENGGRNRESGLERAESWVYYIFPNNMFALQAGRQSFKDKREWWWDNDLDAIRLHFERGPVRGEIAIAEELAGLGPNAPLDAEDKDVSRILGNVSWRWAERQQIGVFWLQQDDNSDLPEVGSLFAPDDEDETDADLNWLGIRARGRVKIKPFGRFYYWIDVARVDGDERVFDFDEAVDGLRVVDDVSEFSIAGTAFDLGVTWRTDLPGELSVTLSYARGSGDNDFDDGHDRSFRQTGLQDNNGKFRGVDRFRYYGELFRPELSNMEIATLSVGRQILTDSSVEVVYHQYRQIDLLNRIRDSRININPTGLDTDLGQELDFVLGLEEWDHWEFELVAAIFYSGKAFGNRSDELSYAAIAKINFNF